MEKWAKQTGSSRIWVWLVEFISYSPRHTIKILLEMTPWENHPLTIRQQQAAPKIYIRGSAEKFIGWPKYSHGMWPNENHFFNIVPPSGLQTPSIGVAVLGFHWSKKSSTADVMSTCELFNRWTSLPNPRRSEMWIELTSIILLTNAFPTVFIIKRMQSDNENWCHFSYIESWYDH